MTTLTVEYYGRTCAYWLHFPKNTAFSQFLRYKLPKSQRIYDRGRRRWRVSQRGLTTVLRYGSVCFGHIDVTSLPTRWQQWVTREFPNHVIGLTPCGAVHRDPFEVLFLRPDAPRELIRAAYLCLSRIHHPDNPSKGGDSSEFLLIKQAFDQLNK